MADGPEPVVNHTQEGESSASTVAWRQGHSWPVQASASCPLGRVGAAPTLGPPELGASGWVETTTLVGWLSCLSWAELRLSGGL